jgi:HEAT repeat protein
MSNNIDKLMEVSRTEKNEELRLKAIQSLGMVDDPRAEKFLQELYESDDSVEVKGTILEAMMWHGNVDQLIRIARTESNRELRVRAVEALSMMDSPKATEFLLELLDE